MKFFNKKTKKKYPVAVDPLPPKIVKQTANYRLVQVQYSSMSHSDGKGNYVVTHWYNHLQLEKLNKDAMEQPTWVFCGNLDEVFISNFDICSNNNNSSWNLNNFINECFLEKS